MKVNQGWTVLVSDRFLWKNVRTGRDMAEVERIQIIVVFSYCGKSFTMKGNERESVYLKKLLSNWLRKKNGKKVECFITVVEGYVEEKENIYYNLKMLKNVLTLQMFSPSEVLSSWFVILFGKIKPKSFFFIFCWRCRCF